MRAMCRRVPYRMCWCKKDWWQKKNNQQQQQQQQQKEATATATTTATTTKGGKFLFCPSSFFLSYFSILILRTRTITFVFFLFIFSLPLSLPQPLPVCTHLSFDLRSAFFPFLLTVHTDLPIIYLFWPTLFLYSSHRHTVSFPPFAPKSRKPHEQSAQARHLYYCCKAACVSLPHS